MHFAGGACGILGLLGLEPVAGSLIGRRVCCWHYKFPRIYSAPRLNPLHAHSVPLLPRPLCPIAGAWPGCPNRSTLRQQRDWSEGTVLLLGEMEGGVELITRDVLEKQVLSQSDGATDVVGELLAERRAEAARDNAE
jgi:hypothetical protein